MKETIRIPVDILFEESLDDFDFKILILISLFKHANEVECTSNFIANLLQVNVRKVYYSVQKLANLGLIIAHNINKKEHKFETNFDDFEYEIGANFVMSASQSKSFIKYISNKKDNIERNNNFLDIENKKRKSSKKNEEDHFVLLQKSPEGAFVRMTKRRMGRAKQQELEKVRKIFPSS